jgi:hypothetical protein
LDGPRYDEVSRANERTNPCRHELIGELSI